MLKKNSKIFLAGHKGLVGSSVLRKLKKEKFINVTYKSRKELDLLDQSKVSKFFKLNKFDAVIIAAAKVGGIHANNKFKAEFIYQNLQIQNNIIHFSYINGIKNLIFLGSSCIYPKFSKQPIKEEFLLSGKLENTNEPYAISKIAGLKMCEFYNFQYNLNYKCLMPSNLYGPNDNYNLENSHFLPSIIRKVYEAKVNGRKFIKIWGSGRPKRELLFVDDLAHAIIFFLGKKTDETIINIGSETENSILVFANKVINYFNYDIKIKFDKSKPDGILRKKLDLTVARKYGWIARTSFDEGLKLTIQDFLKNNKKLRQ